MKTNLSLIALLQRQLLPVALVVLPVGALYVLFNRVPLSGRDPGLAMLVLAHSLALAMRLGGAEPKRFAYLYTRGYSRDRLWWYTMASTVLAVLWVWLPMSLIVWLPIRSVVQDRLFASPYFPLFRIREAVVPLAWLGGYAILVPVFHYVWIRRAQPTRGGTGAVLLAVALVVVGATLLNFRWYPDWFRVVVGLMAAVVSLTALTGGFLLHRTVEVRS